MIVLTFPSGVRIRGIDASDCLARLADVQFVKRPISVNELKVDMSDRAYVWSDSAVDPLLDDETFLRECAKARLFTMSFPRPPKKGA